MAAQEDQPEDVVLDVVDLRVEIGHPLLLPPGVPELGPFRRSVSSRRKRSTPRRLAAVISQADGLSGTPAHRPLLQRGDERVLSQVLGQPDVTRHPGDRADEASPLRTPGGDDVSRGSRGRRGMSLPARGQPSELERSVVGRLGALGHLAQRGGHGDLGPVPRVQLGEHLRVGHRLLELSYSIIDHPPTTSLPSA